MYNIIIGIIFLVGGLTGKMALFGTSSSGALAAVGGGLVLWGAYQEFQKRSAG